MRPRGREEEKSAGRVRALSGIRIQREFAYRSPVRKIQKMEFHRKSGLKIPQEKRTGPQSSVDCSSLRTFEAVDVAQVDARDVLDVRQVLGQRELAGFVQPDAVLAVLRANVADHANDRAGEDACVEEEK